jgi:hypothetical protein
MVSRTNRKVITKGAGARSNGPWVEIENALAEALAKLRHEGLPLSDLLAAEIKRDPAKTIGILARLKPQKSAGESINAATEFVRAMRGLVTERRDAAPRVIDVIREG